MVTVESETRTTMSLSVPLARMSQLHLAVAQVQRVRCRQHLVGRGDHDLADGVALVRGELRGQQPSHHRRARLGHERRAVHVPPDRQLAEPGVAEGVVPVPMRVHGGDHRLPAQGRDVGEQLVGVSVGEPGVHGHQTPRGPDDRTRLIGGFVAADPDAVTQLEPAIPTR